jgi:GTP diphosphokinase / guanosine-3',5'-bis(diphosphate) 3'-diphosphatase
MVNMSNAELFELTSRADFSDDDKKLVRKAYKFAAEAHEGQKRYSGEPYFNHVLATAIILNELGMDAPSIAAGLLHDVIEDTEITEVDVKLEFGDQVVFLVNSVTKLGTVRFRGSDRHIESLRKLFVATSEDIRVLIIKLADRLHNMRTLEFVPAKKQVRIAKETMEVYAPIAHRLNMGQIKGELEDLAFPILYPEEHARVLELAKDQYKKSENSLRKIKERLENELAKEKIKIISTDYRRKHLWSLYQKLKRKDMDIDQIYDISALRVIVNTKTQCYQVLGTVHSIWRPLPGRIKDYVAFPKPNGYQSIHTTIFTGSGELAEVQIRTKTMHTEAEFGIASHYQFKSEDSGSWSADLFNRLLGKTAKSKLDVPDWIAEMAEVQTDNAVNTDQFMINLRDDFFSNRIFVFTPKGDVIDLPTGSTSIDFAYHVHTKIGSKLSGAKINGKLSSLDTELKNGDIVEIITSKNAKPKHKWLEIATTSMAKRRIRAALANPETNN